MNHIPDTGKMVSDTPMTDAADIYIRTRRDFTITDHQVWQEHGEHLERELNAANERIRLLIAERDTARRQADQNYKLREEFRELLGTVDVEQGVAVVREMKQRIKRLEEMYEGEIGENEQFLGSNLQGLLTRELNWSKDRIKQLEEAGDEAIYKTNMFDREAHWFKAKEAKP